MPELQQWIMLPVLKSRKVIVPLVPVINPFRFPTSTWVYRNRTLTTCRDVSWYWALRRAGIEAKDLKQKAVCTWLPVEIQSYRFTTAVTQTWWAYEKTWLISGTCSKTSNSRAYHLEDLAVRSCRKPEKGGLSTRAAISIPLTGQTSSPLHIFP